MALFCYFFSFSTLFHLSLMFFRPEVPSNSIDLNNNEIFVSFDRARIRHQYLTVTS